MSGKFRFEIPDQRRAAPRPPRRRERDKQPIPRNAPAINVDLNWRAEVELVVGVPRADRKAKRLGNA
jgi:hypothetical protein